jgi:hypothetical protein
MEKTELRQASDAALNWLATPDAKKLDNVKEQMKSFEAVYSRVAPAIRQRINVKLQAAAEEEAKRTREAEAQAGGADAQQDPETQG